MINKISIIYIQLLGIILETAPNLLQPEYSIKLLNTENTVLSLGDVDNDDDLEIIKSPSEDAEMQDRLSKLHKYVNSAEITDRPKEKLYLKYYGLKNSRPLFEMSYPDSLHTIAVNEKHLRELERRYKNERKRRKRKKKRKIWHRREFGKLGLMGHTVKMVPQSPPDVEEAEVEYNYFEKEYLDEVAKIMNSSTGFKYSDEGKPEESIKDVVIKIVDVKTPKNCSNYRGIGIQAFECTIRNFKDGGLSTKQLFYSIGIILLIWFGVYLLVAVPFWCSKGWCCCCFRCNFCFPLKTASEIQKYIALNPPGVYIDSEGVKKQYVPTPKETEIYERLRRLIADF